MIGKSIPKYEGLNGSIWDTEEQAMQDAITQLAKTCMSKDYATFGPCFVQKLQQHPEVLDWLNQQVQPQVQPV